MRLTRRRRSDDGAAAVEFALILPIFSLLLFGLIEFGYYFYTAQTTNSAARETARRIVVGHCWDQTAATIFAQGHAPQLTGTVQVVPTPSATMDVGDTITVTVQADSGLSGFVPGIPGTVTRDYEARMEFVEDALACP